MSAYDDYVSSFGLDPSQLGGGDSSPTLVASTGKNDPNSAYGSGLLSFFTGATNTAGNVLTALNQTDAQKKAAAAASKNATATSSLTKIIILGVGAVLAVIVVIALFRRGK